MSSRGGVSTSSTAVFNLNGFSKPLTPRASSFPSSTGGLMLHGYSGEVVHNNNATTRASYNGHQATTATTTASSGSRLNTMRLSDSSSLSEFYAQYSRHEANLLLQHQLQQQVMFDDTLIGIPTIAAPQRPRTGVQTPREVTMHRGSHPGPSSTMSSSSSLTNNKYPIPPKTAPPSASRSFIFQQQQQQLQQSWPQTQQQYNIQQSASSYYNASASNNGSPLLLANSLPSRVINSSKSVASAPSPATSTTSLPSTFNASPRPLSTASGAHPQSNNLYSSSYPPPPLSLVQQQNQQQTNGSSSNSVPHVPLLKSKSQQLSIKSVRRRFIEQEKTRKQQHQQIAMKKAENYYNSMRLDTMNLQGKKKRFTKANALETTIKLPAIPQPLMVKKIGSTNNNVDSEAVTFINEGIESTYLREEIEFYQPHAFNAPSVAYLGRSASSSLLPTPHTSSRDAAQQQQQPTTNNNNNSNNNNKPQKLIQYVMKRRDSEMLLQHQQQQHAQQNQFVLLDPAQIQQLQLQQQQLYWKPVKVKFPDRVIENIVSFLDGPDLFRAVQTCKRLCALIMNDDFFAERYLYRKCKYEFVFDFVC